MNDNKPPPGAMPSREVLIVGVVVDDGRVILNQPLPRPKPAKPRLVKG